MESSRCSCSTVLARIGDDAPLTLRRLPPCASSLERSRLEAFIGERFADRYGARIRHFMPDLLGLEDADGKLLAAVGLRGAGDGGLFLERYLDHPVEAEIARAAGMPLLRERVVEVGNLAALGAGHARLLIVALTDLLVAEGFDWVVFTGTAELLNSFRRLDLAPLALVSAEPARMGDELPDWGSYYDRRPCVMAGHIAGGHRRLLHAGTFHRVGYRPFRIAPEVNHVAVA